MTRRFPRGETMTINEMIAELERRRDIHGGDTPVCATWETVKREIELENIYFTADDRTLWIDADYNSYRPNDAI